MYTSKALLAQTILTWPVDLRCTLLPDFNARACATAAWVLKLLLIQHHGGSHISQSADDQDEFIGALSLGTAQDEDSDVRAVDRFHGLRVAHPLEAHKMGQGITVGRDASCCLVVDQPSVSCTLSLILLVMFGKVTTFFQSCLAKSQYGAQHSPIL